MIKLLSRALGDSLSDIGGPRPNLSQPSNMGTFHSGTLYNLFLIKDQFGNIGCPLMGRPISSDEARRRGCIEHDDTKVVGFGLTQNEVPVA